MRLYTQYIIIFILGSLCTYIILSRNELNTIETTDAEEIFISIINASDLSISNENIHCELARKLNEIDNKLIYHDIKVRDFIAFYLNWSQVRTGNSFSRLTCERKGNLRECIWQFGKSTTSEEGWDRILKFTYDQNTNSIIPNSLKCIDVP